MPATGAGGKRSIPTGVGKTQSLFENYAEAAVHPHGCGENNIPCQSFDIVFGPSPRVWGKQPAIRQMQCQWRSIPTGVGKTCLQLALPSQQPVHPHGCGENRHERLYYHRVRGPSPRVWGKRTTRIIRRTQVRSIPTGVGKTNRQTSTDQGQSVHPHGCGENEVGLLVYEVWDGPSPRVWGKL